MKENVYNVCKETVETMQDLTDHAYAIGLLAGVRLSDAIDFQDYDFLMSKCDEFFDRMIEDMRTKQ